MQTVFPYTGSGQKMLLPKTDVAPVSDDDMIQQMDVQKLPCF